MLLKIPLAILINERFCPVVQPGDERIDFRSIGDVPEVGGGNPREFFDRLSIRIRHYSTLSWRASISQLGDFDVEERDILIRNRSSLSVLTGERFMFRETSE